MKTVILRRSRGRRAAGFTLIEVIVAVTIIAILAAIALPSYTAYVNRGYRSEARGALTQAAQWMERLRTERGTYANATLPGSLQQSPATGAPKYLITVASAAGTYTLTATPTGTMVGDECGNLTLDNTGLRGAAGNMQLCWGR